MKKQLLFYLFLLLGGTYVSAQTYELDNSFTTGLGFNGEVNITELDANGKVLFAGDFTSYDGTTRNYIARLNTDGTVDTNFDPTTALSSSVYDIAIHADGSITTVGGNGIKRFDNTGTEFSGGTFTAASTNNIVNVAAAEATGFGIIIGGDFTDIGGKIARLIEAGTVDAAFAGNIGTGFNGSVLTIEITGAGQLLVGGSFTSFNGTTRNRIALLNSDGTLDTNFDPGTVLSTNVYAVAMQDDGKVLAGSSTLSTLVRLNADGSNDTNFSGVTSTFNYNIRDIHVDGTNDIIIGGWFEQGVVAKDYTTGATVDIAGGNGVEGASKEVNSLVALADGSIVLGGDFTSYNGFTSTNVAKIATCDVSIDTQPSNSSVCETTDAFFSVTASGTGTLTYQWQENTASGVGVYTNITDGGVYGGATTATLDLTAVTTGMTGYYYRCIVTDDNCSSMTSPSTLTVNTPQVITVDPVDVSACVGGNATFSISYTGGSGAWQWQEDSGSGFTDITTGGVYSGATSDALTITGVTTDMTGYKYQLVATYCNPSSTTPSVTLTVNEIPVVIEVIPTVQGVCVSGDASYTISATASSGTLTYQWQYYINGGTYGNLSDGAIYSGTNTATLLVTGADNTLAENYDSDNADGVTSAAFRCIVTANSCSANSAGLIYLNVHDAPVVTTQPLDITECDTNGAGVTKSISVQTEATPGGLHYQWQVDDGTGYVDIADDATYAGVTTRTLAFTGATSILSGNLYRCEIGACSTPVYSDPSTLTINDIPDITSGPVNTSLCEGSDLTFTVEATGNDLSYQWEVAPAGTSSFVAIANDDTYFAAGNTLEISSLTTNFDAKRYRCVLTSGSCSRNSSTGTIRVYSQPSLSVATSTNALTVCEGGSTTLRVNPSSTVVSGVHAYKWQSDNGIAVFTDITDDANFSGSDTRNLTIADAPIQFSGIQYRCTIVGCITQNASTPETLTVNQLPLVTTSPISQTICLGESVSFTAEATGTDVTYQWYYSADGGNNFTTGGFSGYTTATLTIDNTPADYDGYIFKCVARSASPCTITNESNPATLTVNEVTITSQPAGVTICNGGDATFSVEAQGNALTYQWLENGVDIVDGGIYSGATTTTLTLTGASTDLYGARYNCNVSGTCVDVESWDSYLTVNGVVKPIITADFSNATQPYLYVSNVSGESFEWFLNGSSYSYEYGQIYVSEAGSYTVIVSVSGCTSEESDAQVIIVTELDKNLLNNIETYPNPVIDKLLIHLAQATENTSIRVTDLNGKVKINQPANGIDNSVDMSGLANGTYLIQVINTENTITYKVIKE